MFSLGLLENSLPGPEAGGLTGTGLTSNRGDGSFTFCKDLQNLNLLFSPGCFLFRFMFSSL